jgi:hypothetical protein
MRKRRVGVTARSRQSVGNQATGTLQLDTEMAAPLELRTPAGTVAKAASRVRMEAWRQRRGRQRQKAVQETVEHEREDRRGGRRAGGAHEALPQTPPGGKPPETPGPLSLCIHVPERKGFVKGSQAAQKPRALDKSLPFRRFAWGEGKGATESRRPLLGPGNTPGGAG